MVKTADGAASIASARLESGLCQILFYEHAPGDGGPTGTDQVLVHPDGSCELTFTSIHGQTARVSITATNHPNIPPLHCRSGPMIYEVPNVQYSTTGIPLQFPAPDGGA